MGWLGWYFLFCVLLGPTGLGWLNWLLLFFTCSVGTNRVGLVELVVVVFYVFCWDQPGWVGWVGCLFFLRVFNSVNRKWLKCVLFVNFKYFYHLNQNWFRLKRLFPIERDLGI